MPLQEGPRTSCWLLVLICSLGPHWPSPRCLVMLCLWVLPSSLAVSAFHFLARGQPRPSSLGVASVRRPLPAVTTITVLYNWMPWSTGPSSHTGSTQQAACSLIVIWVPWLALKGRRYYLDLSPVSQVPLEKTGPDPHVSLPSLLPFATSHPVRPAPPVVLGRKKHKHHSAFTSPSPSGLLRNETVCPSVTVHQFLPLNVALKELKT